MRNKSNVCVLFIALALLVTPTLTSCGATATPTAVPATKVQPTPTAQGPQVGGKVTYALYGDPDSLDSHHSEIIAATDVLYLLGASLVALDPDGQIKPYLAESWNISSDGLVWDFSLRRDVKFHDGSPLTAHDYVWTIERAKNPDTKAAGAVSASLGAIESAEAVDDYTLRLRLANPYYSLLFQLSDVWTTQPLLQTAVEKAGDGYGHSPVGVGPYVFKEWQTGQKIVLERNPDYLWAPAFLHQGPAYIQTIEFRIIPEMSTLLAGVESGEIDIADTYVSLQAKDIPRIKATGKFNVYEGLVQGLRPYILMNVTKAPFDDVRVRKAFNLAVDRESMIKVRAQGNAIPQNGPLSPSQIGYWSGVEEIGYGFDLAQAKALMAEAGYKPGANGILEKDSQPLKLTLISLPQEMWIKAAEILQEQWKALGVEIEIVQIEAATAITQIMKGEYTLSVMGSTGPESDILYLMFHSENIPGYNMSQIRDIELDRLLTLSRTETDAAKHQEAVNQVQKYIVEKAVVVFLYVPKTYTAISTRVRNAVYSTKSNLLYIHDAYVETK